MKWIWTLFLASTCFGQLTMQSMQPFFNGTSSKNTILALGPTFWWVADDRSNVGNGNTITNWIDRISGNIKTNSSSLEPTYDSTKHAASFSGTTWFSNTTTFNATLFSSAVTLVAVFAPTTPVANGALIATDDAGGHGPIYATSGGKIHSFASGSGDIYSYATTVPYVYSQRWTNGNNNVVYFTNQVKITVQSFNIYGGGSIKYNGKDQIGSPYKGTLVEEIWFPTPLTDDQITNTIYQYYRSTYPTLFP